MASSFREERGADGRRRPPIPEAGQDLIEDRDEERQKSERPQQSVRAEQTELDESCAGRHEDRKEDPTRARVGSRFWIGDHEEGEEEERAALEAVKRDRDRLAERERARDDQESVEGEERESHVAPRGAPHDEEPDARDQEPEERRGSPLAG